MNNKTMNRNDSVSTLLNFSSYVSFFILEDAEYLRIVLNSGYKNAESKPEAGASNE